MKTTKQQIHESVSEQLLEEVLRLKERVVKHKQGIYSPVNSLLTIELRVLISQCNALLRNLPIYPDGGLSKDHPSYVSHTSCRHEYDTRYQVDATENILVSEIENRAELNNRKYSYMSRDKYLRHLAKLLSKIPQCRSKLESQSIRQILLGHFQNGAHVPLWLEL